MSEVKPYCDDVGGVTGPAYALQLSSEYGTHDSQGQIPV